MSIKNVISLSTAGGGKTTRLVQRVKDLIKNGTDKNRILIISFTNASCEDIYLRSDIKAETIHSFCYRFLDSKYTIEENCQRFTSIFLEDFFHLNALGENVVNNLLNSFYIFKKIFVDLDNLSPKDKILNQEFGGLVQKIETEKANHNCLFFSDIIHLFKSNIEIYSYDIHNQYDHILVDEAQDLSENQLFIIQYLIENIFLEEEKSFFIVGDVKQSIYNFQGASPKFYLQFLDNLRQLCDQYQRVIEFEKNTKTYRFGGEILAKVNNHFESHSSGKTQGDYEQILIYHPGEIQDRVEDIILKHLDINESTTFMILFEKNNKLVENLQNAFYGLGKNIKIFTQNNDLVEALKNILFFLQSNNSYYGAKILQGPFYHLEEPHFYLMAQDLQQNILDYDQRFFQQLQALRHNPPLLIEFLTQKCVFLDSINEKLLQKIYEMSFSYNSFDSLVLNLPDSIKVTEDGINFSTLHSSKGLEADVVILLPRQKTNQKVYVNLNPFFFFFDDFNEFTHGIIESKIKEDQATNKNLYYVGLTRAKEFLYEINYE